MASDSVSVFIDWDYKNKTYVAMSEFSCASYAKTMDEIKALLAAKGYELVNGLEWRLKNETNSTNK